MPYASDTRRLHVPTHASSKPTKRLLHASVSRRFHVRFTCAVSQRFHNRFTPVSHLFYTFINIPVLRSFRMPFRTHSYTSFLHPLHCRCMWASRPFQIRQMFVTHPSHDRFASVYQPFYMRYTFVSPIFDARYTPTTRRCTSVTPSINHRFTSVILPFRIFRIGLHPLHVRHTSD